jgi:hypothetical protein
MIVSPQKGVVSPIHSKFNTLKFNNQSSRLPNPIQNNYDQQSTAIK